MESEQGFRSPNLPSEDVKDILKANYGMNVKSIKKLDGYDDKNYHVEVFPDVDNKFIDHVWPHGYVLKIMNALDSKHETFVNAQHALVKHLSENDIIVPLPVKNIKGESYSVMSFNTNFGYIVRLMTFIPGTILVDTPSSYDKLRNIGEFVGRLSLLIKDFKNEGFDKRDSIWFLGNFLRVKSYLNHIEDQKKVDMVKKALEEFEINVLPLVKEHEIVLIHGDVNENNLLVCGNEVAGLLDFGDSHYSHSIYEIAINICYMLIYANAIEAGKPIMEGYLKFMKMGKKEKNILKACVSARLCQSLVLGIYNYKQDPSNEYILSSQKTGWDILTKLSNLTNSELLSIWGLN